MVIEKPKPAARMFFQSWGTTAAVPAVAPVIWWPHAMAYGAMLNNSEAAPAEPWKGFSPFGIHLRGSMLPTPSAPAAIGKSLSGQVVAAVKHVPIPRLISPIQHQEPGDQLAPSLLTSPLSPLPVNLHKLTNS